MSASLNSVVDEVFLINLPSATERLEKVDLELKRNNIRYSKITPVPSINFDIKETEQHENYGWNNNAKSLQETTKNIIRLAKEKGHKRIFIFEDDSFIHDETMSQFIDNFEKFNQKFRWDFIHLNWTGNHFRLHRLFNFRGIVGGVLRCQAYMINSSVFDLYLGGLEKFEFPIDHTTRLIHIKRKLSFIYEPKAVYQKTGEYSTIREKEVEY
jgi:hypothetical protein